MKISIGKLRTLIREAMITSLAPGMRVIIDYDGRNLEINILEAGKPKAHGPGFITLQRIQVEGGTIWEVVSSGAKKGYGPLLYDIGMEYVVGRIGGLGITPDRSNVSGEAQGIWDFYLNRRPDVENKPLPENVLYATDRPESLGNYYYKRGTPTLDSFEDQNLIEYRT